MCAAVVAAAMSLGCTSEPPPVAQPRKAPRDPKLVELAGYIRIVTGDGAIDCGLHPFARDASGALARATEGDLIRSRDCALRAAASGTPFWTYAQYPGVEAWSAFGLVGARDGTIYVMSFDGAPGGASSLPGRFSIETCRPPVVVTDPPWLRYHCTGPQ